MNHPTEHHSPILEDINKIKQLLDSPDDFCKFLKESLASGGIERGIEVLKVSGICFSPFGANKHADLFQASMAVLVGIFGKEDASLKRLMFQISLLEEIFADFRLLMQRSGINDIPKENRVASFIIACESLLSSLLEYSKGVSWEDVQKKYPVVKRPLTLDGRVLLSRTDGFELGAMYEQYAGYVGKILTYFYYQKLAFEAESGLLQRGQIEIASRNLQLFDIFDRLIFLYESWLYGGWGLDKSDGKIVFYPLKNELCLSRTVSLYRYNHLQKQTSVEFVRQLGSASFDPTTKELFPKGLRSFQEVYAGLMCEDLLGVYDLTENILGVSIAEWLRAFTLISEAAMSFSQSAKRSTTSLRLIDWCLSKSKTDWIELFSDGGISHESAEVIICNIIFESGDQDIFDRPLIRLKDSFSCIPSAAMNLSAAESFISNFSSHQADISFKGKKFEKEAFGLVKDAGLPTFDLEESFDGESYECDVAFLLDGEMYFIECKSFIQPRRPKEYYELLVKISEASVQLNRIAAYFSTQSACLKKEVGSLPWTGKSHKIILTKAFLGGSCYINDCYVIDESAFRMFFMRKDFSIGSEDTRINIKEPTLIGEITGAKMLEYLKNPPQIRVVRQNHELKGRAIKLAETILAFYDYDEITPFFKVS